MTLRARLIGLYEDVVREFNGVHQPAAPPQRPQRRPSANAQPVTHPATRVMPAVPPNPMGNGPWPLTPALNSVSVTLDANGDGTVSLGPQHVREHFQVDSASVAVAPLAGQTAPLKQAACSVYVGTSVNASTFFGTSVTGSTGDTCSVNGDLQTGQLVWAVWTGGDVGAVATMSLNGQRTIGAPAGS